jgi:hypothetical protein
MSYKFQRLRERIRQAVASGELSGKLPGERELARRFRVNAKTLSKALTDLAAEGLLHRSIGRGTFVRGAENEKPAPVRPWLVLLDAEVDPALVRGIKGLAPAIETCNDVSSIRPSFLNQFSAVVDLAGSTPEAFIRNLLVRGIPVVSVGQEPRAYSVNTVMLDSLLGVSHLTRQLILGGHRHFLAIEQRTRIVVAQAIRGTAARYCQDFCVDACTPADVVQAVEFGATACICDSVQTASKTMEMLQRGGIVVPQRVSVGAIGYKGGDYPCTGYYVDPGQQAAAVVEVLTSGQHGRPTAIWLAGTQIDGGTLAAIPSQIPISAAQAALAAQASVGITQ